MKAPSFTILAAAALIISNASPASASGVQFDPPKSFYLALGDSLAFGYQQAKFDAHFPTENPAVFDTGYVDDFSAMLRNVRPEIRTVNFGCPGETTVSFINGPCPYESHGFLNHNDYSGAQLDAALGFLRSHPGQVSPITINLGSADVTECGPDPTCIADEIAAVRQNMRTSLTALRSAAPDAEILVMLYYNPFAAVAPSTNAFVEALNAALADVAAAARAAEADLFPAFNMTADVPATLCDLTLECTSFQDVHPSDEGYAVIARQFWSASGYERLA